MKRFLILSSFLALFLLPSFLSAQTSVKNSFEGLAVIEKSLLNIENQNWVYHAEDGSNLLYIDFDKINMNLNQVFVKNESGAVMYQDEVWDLPVDAIYEIDLAQFPKGAYVIEVNAFTKTFKKEVSTN